MIIKNTDLYKEELDSNFDIQEEEADYKSKNYRHLAGYISFFMAECPVCSCTMPFGLDEGVCMACCSDPSDGILDDMTEEEIETLIHNNLYHIKLPYVRRKKFETLPEMLDRQLKFRCEEALKKYKGNTNIK